MPTSANEIWAQVVRRKMGMSPGTHFEDLEEPHRTWALYMLEAVDRGRGVVSALAAHGWHTGVSFMDAGCAYGGYLVAAADAGARRIAGIDIDPKYLDMARELLSAHGVHGQLELGDLESDELHALLCSEGGFDFITCTDVLEHVADPSLAMDRLVRYLAPGGRIYLTIPNFRNPSWVRSDPHFQIAGITLLPPQPARAMAYAIHPWLPRYSVGEYHPLKWYRQRLAELGLQTWLLNPPANALAETAATVRSDALRIVNSLDELLDVRLDNGARKMVRDSVKLWADQLADEISVDRPDPSVLDEYAVQTWELLAVRA